MNFFILASCKETSDSIRRLVSFVFSSYTPRFSFGYLGQPESIMPQDWKEAELLIVEAIHPENPENPEGWRTAKKSQKKALVIFTYPVSQMRKDIYFIASSALEIGDKLENVIKMPPATQKDYISLESQYPFLSRVPTHHR